MTVGPAVTQSVTVTGWQIASTIATATAAVVAVAVAVQNLVQRASDRGEKMKESVARSIAQARLVVVEGNGYKKRNSGPEGNLNTRAWVTVHNYSDRAILDLKFEAWPRYTSIVEAPAFGNLYVLPVGEKAEVSAVMKQTDDLKAFRVRWTDADGKDWYLEHKMTEPALFVGQAPRELPTIEGQ